jgi:2-dehydro-3-deoxygalactonokinase
MMAGRPAVDAIVGDWGGSRLRLWRLQGGDVVASREAAGVLQTDDHAALLRDTIGDWTETRVVLCGMAGARGALREVPYVACPAAPVEWRQRAADFRLAGFDLRIAAGLSLDRDGRPDVMRGEETQVFGAMSLDPALAEGRHVIVLPGTHSKWVRLEAGRIAHFRTFMTGELFALLAGSSLALGGEHEGNADEGFAEGLSRAGTRAALSAALFEARAAQLVSGRTGAWARGFVSGLLIGSEIAEAAPDGAVLVIGAAELAGRYGEALAGLGVDVHRMDDEACAIAGLRWLDDDR